MGNKIIFIISFLLFYIISNQPFILNAQNINKSRDIREKREIRWKTIESLNNSHKRIFYFDGAIFEDSNLPFYYERIKIQTKDDRQQPPDIRIENPIFDEITNEELEFLSDSLDINNEIHIKSEIKTSQKIGYLCINFIPLKRNKYTGRFEKLTSFELVIKDSDKNQLSTVSYRKTTKSKSNGRTYASHSVLSKGTWFKIGVTNTGIQRITYQDLINAGVNINSLNPKNIRIYGNGGGILPEKNSDFRYDDLVENPVSVVGEEDGNFGINDYIIFYGRGQNIWKYDSIAKKFFHSVNIYSDINYYFLNTDLGPGKRVQTENSTTLPATLSINKFNDYAYHEKDLLSLIKSGSQWYGEVFDIQTSYDFSFNFPDIDNQSPVTLRTYLAARSEVQSSFFINADDNIYKINMSLTDFGYNNGPYADTSVDEFNYKPKGSSINLNLSYNKPQSSSLGWLNYIELNVVRYLNFNNSQLMFRSINSTGKGAISEFSLSNSNSRVKIWNITDPVNVFSVETTLNGSILTFRLPTETLKEFIAFNDNSYFSPKIIGNISNQDLHGVGQVDMLIVTHPDFYDQAQRIASLHKNTDKLSVLITTPELIYNEFSSGSQDIIAIRDLLKMFYDRADTSNSDDINSLPKYLLLFGDASYDYKNRVPQNTNFVPTYESPNSLDPTNSYLTDDYFGLLDNNEGYYANGDLIGDLDIGIGRFPVKNKEEAKNVVDKIVRYVSQKNLAPGNIDPNTGRNAISNFADWKNTVCFVADDKDYNLHLNQAQTLAQKVTSKYKQYNVDKIYIDAYKEISTPGGQRYPDATTAINKRTDNGAFLINYTGHGGQLGWAHERIIEITDINNWNNKYNMPIFMTATCEFGPFDDPSYTAAGDLVFINPNGGGIALFTTTRLAWSNTNAALNHSFINFVFNKIDGKYPRLGDIIRQSKVDNNSNSEILNFVLLGDPALTLSYPKYKVVTDSILKSKIVNLKSNDTLKAFSQVTVYGSITDDNNNKIKTFNGSLYPTVFDKPDSVSTLSNDGSISPKLTFTIQKSILYKGMASIDSGYFKFTFIVPKDIKYRFDAGKISYYAVSDSLDKKGNIIPVTDATGYNQDLIIGGSEDSVITLNTGPHIRLYIDTTTFVSGGNTDTNPLLLAALSDNYGINTTGNSIGHDITAVLDGNTESTIVLNDYYQSDLNSYKSGSIKYKFSNLSPGLHSLKFKAWNIFNISSEAEIKFYVVKGYEIYNFPNPFSPRSVSNQDLFATNFCFQHNYSLTDINIRLQISIFDITGKLFCALDKTVTDAYDYVHNVYRSAYSWDGKNENNCIIKPGIYIYKLNATNTQGLNINGYGKLKVL